MKLTLLSSPNKTSFYKFILIVIICCLLLLNPLICIAQKKDSLTRTEDKPDNGIGVSDPKVFDNRSLMIMLDQLNRNLNALQPVDPAKLASALGLIQGTRQNELNRSFEATTLPIPGVTTTRSQIPQTREFTTTSEVTTQAGVTPSIPELPGSLSNPAYNPPYGISAQDLLSEQINLTYQIYNLRMLLERSLTDRLIETTDSQQSPRLQTVLGFQISLDPPKSAKGEAAFVEVNVEPLNASDKPVSLVALMPQEKTYNATALSTKSNAFSGAAVVKVVSVGYSERRRGQTFYLYQDTDTLTFQRMKNSNKNQRSVTLEGKIKKPSKGTGKERNIVLTGIVTQSDTNKAVSLTGNIDSSHKIQLTGFIATNNKISLVGAVNNNNTNTTETVNISNAVLQADGTIKLTGKIDSLGDFDLTGLINSQPEINEDIENRDNVSPTFGWQFRPVLGRPSVTPGTKQMFAVISVPSDDKYLNETKFDVRVRVKTYWRKYKKDSFTTIPENLNERTYIFNKTIIPTTTAAQKALQPSLKSAKWYATDDKNAVVLINGSNFFSGTSVVVGNKIFDNPSNGLEIKSDQSMQLRIPIADLVSGNVIINGRYGGSIALQLDSPSEITAVELTKKLWGLNKPDDLIILKNRLSSLDTAEKLAAELAKNNITDQEFSDYKTKISNVKTIEDMAQILMPEDRLNEYKQRVSAEIHDATISMEQGNKFANLSIWVKSKNNLNLLLNELPSDYNPVIAVQNVPILGPYNIQQRYDCIVPDPTDSTKKLSRNCILIQAVVPAELLKNDALVSLKFPFWGTRWSSSFVMTGAATYQISRLGVVKKGANPADSEVTFMITGRFAAGDWKVELDQTYNAKWISNKLLTVNLKESVVNNFKNLLLVPPTGANLEAMVLQIPDSSPAPLKPSIDKEQKPKVFVESSVGVKFTGEFLGAIKEAIFEGEKLEIKPSPDGKEITIFLNRKVTAKAGPIQILLRTDKELIPVDIIIEKQ
jgi:hypothetical protein